MLPDTPTFDLARVIPCRCLDAVLPLGHGDAYTWELLGLPLILGKEDKASFLSDEIIRQAAEWLQSFGSGRRLMVVAQDLSDDSDRGRITLICPYDPATGALLLKDTIEHLSGVVERTPIAILAF